MLYAFDRIRLATSKLQPYWTSHQRTIINGLDYCKYLDLYKCENQIDQNWKNILKFHKTSLCSIESFVRLSFTDLFVVMLSSEY